MKKKSILKYFLILLLFFVLHACGGGDGGGGGVTSAPTVTTASISGSAVGTIGISNLVGVSKAGVTKSAGTEELIGGAKVVIESYHNGQLHKTYEAVTDPNLGTFNIPIQLWSDGGYIVVNIEKDGLVKYSKTFTYSKPEDLKSLNLKAELAPYLKRSVSFANISATDFFKSTTEDTLSIAIVQDAKGVKKLATNDEIKVAKASGGVVRWQMDLSKSLLKAASSDIGNSITIKAQNYDPTNPEDMKSFPAESDTSGNKLVSTGFDFIDIKTSTGKTFCVTKDGKYGTLDSNGNCVVSATSAKKQSAIIQKSAIVPFKVKRQIDDCKIAEKDEDANKPGKQVGFYINRNGKWLKIGNATLYNSSAFSGLNYGELDDTKLFTGTCNENDKPYAVFTDEELKKASKDLGFDLSWYNFDYVAMGDLKTFCIEGEFKKVKKNEKSALSGLYLYVNKLEDNNSNNVSGFRSAYGYTDENGKFKIEGVTTSIDVNYQIELSFNDPFTYKWTVKNKKLKAKSASGCYQVDLEEIADPFECTVTGTARKADGSVYANKYLYAYVKDKWFGYRYSYTDSNGLYTIPVLCGEDYILTDSVDTFNFKVDGNPIIDSSKNAIPNDNNYDETDDTGKQVVLNPQFPNHKPYVYAYANQYDIRAGESVQLYGYAWDPDGDKLTYSWSSGGFGNFSTPSKLSPIWTAPSVGGTYTLTLTASDGSLSNSANVKIEVVTGNRPPKITYLYVPFSVVEGDTVNLYASAYDADGDTLSYSWSANGGTFDSSSKQNPKWTAPSVSSKTTYRIELSVNDGNSSETSSRNIVVYPDTNPVIVSTNIPTIVTPGSSNTISAYAYDPEGKPVTYSWTINGGNPTTSSSSNFSWTAPTAEGTVTINLTVSDGIKSTSLPARTISIKRQNTAPVITNFNVPESGGINKSITISATATDAESKELIYSFYVDGSLIKEVKSSEGSASATWTPRTRKSFTISVVVSDGALTAKSSKTFTVTNIAPVISSVSVPSTATGGTAVTFSATATDADGDPLTYTWYVNNVSIGQGATKSYTFTKKGTYNVKVTVSDGTVTITSQEYTVTVPNQPPVVGRITGPSTGTVGTSVTFSVTASDPDGDTLTYTWFVGTTQIGTGSSINWTPTKGGSYLISVDVSDGSAVVKKNTDIYVNTKPTVTNINVSPSAPQAGQTVTLTAVASDADNDTLTYEWYIQNVKQTGTGSSITWVPSSAGTYTIEVRVSDGRVTTPVSFSKQVTVTGTVTNQPPTTPTIEVTPGAGRYTLYATATDPDNGPSPLTYTWYINGTLLGTGREIVWNVTAEGTYTVKVVVSDGVATAEKTQTVTVGVTANINIR